MIDKPDQAPCILVIDEKMDDLPPPPSSSGESSRSRSSSRREGGRDTERPPGFDDSIVVLGSVLMDEVWPLMWNRAVSMADLYNMARFHPALVYIGLLVDYQGRGWTRFKTEVRDDLIRKALEWERDGKLGR